jgi:hypothetical protein
MNRSVPAAIAMRCAALESTGFRGLCSVATHCVLSVALLIVAGRAAAIGPEAPVDFVDVYLPKGYMLLVMEPSQIVDIDVVRAVHRDGEPLSRVQVPWKSLRMLDYVAPITGPEHFRYRDPDERDKRPSAKAAVRVPDPETAQARPALELARPGEALVVRDERPKRVGALIPLAPESHRDLKDGAYAERFTVRAHLAGAGARDKPVTMARWVHFVVRGGKVNYIDAAEYSRLVDPASEALDSAGDKGLVNTGRAIKAEVPLERTKHYRAIPLGRLGGVSVEREVAPREREQNETNER